MQRLVPAGTQDGLAQPTQTEHEQERTDDHPQGVDGDVANEGDATATTRTPRTTPRQRRAEKGGAPAPADTGCHHDGEGLDHLDQAGPETAMTRTKVDEVCMATGAEITGYPRWGPDEAGQG